MFLFSKIPAQPIENPADLDPEEIAALLENIENDEEFKLISPEKVRDLKIGALHDYSIAQLLTMLQALVYFTPADLIEDPVIDYYSTVSDLKSEKRLEYIDKIKEEIEAKNIEARYILKSWDLFKYILIKTTHAEILLRVLGKEILTYIWQNIKSLRLLVEDQEKYNKFYKQGAIIFKSAHEFTKVLKQLKTLLDQ